MKKLRRLFTDDKGNILVLFALSLTMLIAITALVVDGGRLYHERSILQNAMDAAALGGAQGLLVSEAEARTIAKESAGHNTFAIDDTNLVITTTSIEASRISTVPTVFAKVMGIATVDVGARAKAIISPLQHGEGISPIAVEKDAIPTDKLSCGNPGDQSGNCNFIRVDGNGAKELQEAIINGAEYEVGDAPYTETGKMMGPVQNAVNTIMDMDASKPYCQTAELAVAAEEEGKDCARLITIMVVETLDLSGSKQVTVLGFADYYVMGMADVEVAADGTETITYSKQGDRIIGEFVRTREVGGIAGGGSYEDYLVQGVKLIE